MSARVAFDWRIFGPALVALCCFVPRALPSPAPAPAAHARSIALPQMRIAASKPRERSFELDPERSSVRFLATGERGELLAECTRIEGRLDLGADTLDGALQLTLDLSSLRALDGNAGDGPSGGPGIRDVLGVLGDVGVEVRSKLVAVEVDDMPGVQLDTWVGTVRIGGRVLQQPMQLWRTMLPGARLRQQGHGTVGGAGFGLPAHGWLGLLEDHFDVTLGLDLAWRRRRDG